MEAPAELRLDIRPRIRTAVEAGRPVVALESTVLTHGIPQPDNLNLARRMESEIEREGAVPATIAVLRGRPTVGLDASEIDLLCADPEARKLNRRDLAAAVALRWTGGTTVSATMALAHLAGIRIFATGGIGGVHRGDANDVSTDLTELSRTPVAVVCSGAKAILDLPRTLEWLETAGVPVVGYATDTFPEFFAAGGTLPVSARVEDALQAAALIGAQLATGTGILICVPCPADVAVEAGAVARAIVAAELEASRRGITGKDLTPFLLQRVAELTAGASLRANLALLANNARVAAEIAASLGRTETR